MASGSESNRSGSKIKSSTPANQRGLSQQMKKWSENTKGAPF